jgi:hypothetical protein
MNKSTAYDRVQSIQVQFRVAATAVARLTHDLQVDPTIARKARFFHSDVRLCGANLEETYIVRMFSEFEATVRKICRSLWPNANFSRTPARILIDRIAARQQVLFDVLDRAHDVRKYRNALVHSSEHSISLALQDCRSRLAQFLSYLPIALLA